MTQKIRIDEENIRLLWALLIVLTLSAGIYLLGNAIWSGSWSLGNIPQLISLLLLGIAGYGIIQITRPLFHFILSVQDGILIIEIWKDEDTLCVTQKIPLHDISELRITPHTPRKAHEALFDFSTNFHLLYRKHQHNAYQTLIDLDDQNFTLKVEDIRKIIRFLQQHQPQITIPDSQAEYF